MNHDKPPIANNMAVYTPINNSYNGYLDGFDPDNDTLHYSMVTGPLYGVLNLTDDGILFIHLLIISQLMIVLPIKQVIMF